MTMGALSGQLQLSYKWPDQRRDVDLLSILFISFWLCSRIMSADFLGLYPHYITSVRWGFWVVDTGLVPVPPTIFFSVWCFNLLLPPAHFLFFLLLLLKSFVMFLMNEFPVVFLPTKKRKCFSCRAYVLRFVTEETCCVAVWSSSFFLLLGSLPRPLKINSYARKDWNLMTPSLQTRVPNENNNEREKMTSLMKITRQCYCL